MKSFTETDAILGDVGCATTLDRATLERQFDHLLAANGPALTRLAASYTNTSSDRDDLLQEIAIAVWKALPQFRGECSDRTFLFRVAHNRGVAFLLRNRSRTSGVLEEIEVHDPAPDPESGLAQEQRVERLKRAIHRLPIG